MCIITAGMRIWSVSKKVAIPKSQNRANSLKLGKEVNVVVGACGLLCLERSTKYDPAKCRLLGDQPVDPTLCIPGAMHCVGLPRMHFPQSLGPERSQPIGP